MAVISTPKRQRPLVGTTIIVTATFTDNGGTLRDPADPTVFVERPDDTEITFPTAQLTHVSTGIWKARVPTDLAGQWYVRAEGTDVLAAVDEAFFIVRPSHVITYLPGYFLLTQDDDDLITEAGDTLIQEF